MVHLDLITCISTPHPIGGGGGGGGGWGVTIMGIDVHKEEWYGNKEAELIPRDYTQGNIDTKRLHTREH